MPTCSKPEWLNMLDTPSNVLDTLNMLDTPSSLKIGHLEMNKAREHLDGTVWLLFLFEAAYCFCLIT